MIIRMAKVEIVGPKELRVEVLETIRGLGVLQLEPEETEGGALIKTALLDDKAMAERVFLEDLQKRIEQILTLLPESIRDGMGPQTLPVLDIIASSVDDDLATCRELAGKRASLRREASELERYRTLLEVLETTMEGVGPLEHLDLLGITVKDPGLLQKLRGELETLTGGHIEIITATSADGTTIGILLTEQGGGAKLQKVLQNEGLPELSFPAALSGLPLEKRVLALRQRMEQVREEALRAQGALDDFARRRRPLYHRAAQWIADRLHLLGVTAMTFETELCFVLRGWMPQIEVVGVEREMENRFGGQVVVEPLSILEQDLDRVPVMLKNPAYFKPFEVLASLLPRPLYTSWDPTPFIGIFFPLFFGLILGDIGYGLILTGLTLLILWRWKDRKLLADGARILGVCSACTLLFGLIYGEFFGDLGHTLGLEALGFDRGHSLLPMIGFALSVGLAHVLLGLALGVVSAVRRRLGRKAVSGLLNILVVVCLTTLLVGLISPLPGPGNTSLLGIIAAAVALMILLGGMLAPLELLKTIGNIISYVRIMAIGLTSVLLAQVANRLGGMPEDVVAGVLVAGLLHLFNLILGIFAPSVHALRLHYVEFFSKFLEYGGRRFEPLERKINAGVHHRGQGKTGEKRS